MGSFRLIGTVAGKEVRELRRDPVTLGVGLLLPLCLLFIFGYALRLDVTAAPTAVVDLDRSPASRELISRFDRSREFSVIAHLTSLRALTPALAGGEVRLGIVIPPAAGRDLRRGEAVTIQVLVDGSFSATARLIAGYADALVAEWATRASALSRESRAVAGSGVEARVWYNPDLDSATAIVPGLFGVILMAFPPLLTALAVVREKERGTIRQILISPLPPWAFVLGKLVPYAALAFVDLALVLAAGAIVFHVPLRGSVPFLLAASLLYVSSTLGIGLFVSSVTRTQVVALLLVLVLTVMPSFMFSGFLYPIFTMPKALQAYTFVFPGRYFVTLSRGVFLKGLGAGDLWPEGLLLALYAGAMVSVAAWRLRARAR